LDEPRGKLVVDLPADAQLFVDDQPMKTNSSRRVFRTPVLEPGQAYYYILRAEVVRDGKKESATQRVIVRPGEESTASFAGLGKSSDKAVASVER
jgi:uncharacterized protein (TIGR03000 family)